MEQYKLVKINTGNTVHLAEYFETPQGITGYDVYCGSGKTGLRPRLFGIQGEINEDNIKCKKCKKRYLEKIKKEEVKQEEIEVEKEMSMDEIRAELKRMKENKISFTIQK